MLFLTDGGVVLDPQSSLSAIEDEDFCGAHAHHGYCSLTA